MGIASTSTMMLEMNVCLQVMNDRTCRKLTVSKNLEDDQILATLILIGRIERQGRLN
jgi:hypothetical protein